MSKNGKYAPPYSLRLTKEERQKLEYDAGHMPLSAYIRARLFDMPSPRRTYRRVPKDQEVFLELLRELSETRISSNLNQLAKAHHQGNLPITEETEQELKEACLAIQELRSEIMNAIGLKPKKKDVS